MDGIRWYGLAYVAGFIAGWALLRLYFKKGRSPFNPEQQADLLTALVIGTLLGGRLGYYLLYRFDELLHDPLMIFRVWEGGMASHGGMVGILLGMVWFTYKNKASFWQVADITVTLGPPGVFFGRLANFINGELYGRPSDAPWAMHFLDYWRNPTTGYGEYFWTPAVHPSQLYQAGMEGLLLTVYLQARFWLSDPAKRTIGQLTGEFLIGYALLRIAGEVFREPDATLILGLSRGSFYSLFMIIAGVAIIAFRRKAASRT
ncbi:prolipoprotein diacylglyceryl transferase [Cerasicoccus arenae]|uniref:Phosphatidylglycerol--prolipoprotein diacylglyceryl transferase n=1 Tax=Cerasicoccus arenae TaxID=424488 RepID=A0A8J3DKU8_9BACT|nr:prolipoprotein diacylglyceryl transferase [Cerasicoccus arenae]MBK1858593.1 prolipoprotein diacylglyceryl transferase [Cerasicoccus arenae]GHC05105.1 prolipoprotein diacylglyceryl transferase [Cerasicoccus arenae]